MESKSLHLHYTTFTTTNGGCLVYEVEVKTWYRPEVVGCWPGVWPACTLGSLYGGDNRVKGSVFLVDFW